MIDFSLIESPHKALIIHSPASTVSYGECDRPFELASVTKLLTAWTVAVAEAEGAISWEDELINGATIRDLLAHCSGLSDTEPPRPPRTRRVYSSKAYAVVADYIEAETGIPFGVYMREALFEPLGMQQSELYGPAGWAARSTASDLLLFVKELLEPTLIDPEPLFHPVAPDLDGVVPGFGVFKPCPWTPGFEYKGEKGCAKPHWMGESLPPSTVGHFGVSGTFVWCDRESQRGAIMLTNRKFGPWAQASWPKLNTLLGSLKLN